MELIYECKEKECNVYFERGGYAVNFEPHDGYLQENTREVMKDLCL